MSDNIPNDESIYSSWSIAAIVMSVLFTVPALILSFIAVKENYNERSVKLAMAARIVSLVRMTTVIVLLFIWALVLSFSTAAIKTQKVATRQFEDAYELIDEYVPLSNTPPNVDIGNILEDANVVK